MRRQDQIADRPTAAGPLSASAFESAAVETGAQVRAYAAGRRSPRRSGRRVLVLILAPVIALGAGLALLLEAGGGGGQTTSSNVAGAASPVADAAAASIPGASAAAASLGAECSLEAPFTTSCSSTNPKLAIYQWNAKDTSACAFTYHLAWGDGSSTTVEVPGSSASSVYIAEHTYRTPGAYSPALTVGPVTGDCAAADVGYSYTYQ